MTYECSKKEAAAFFKVSVQALDGWFTAGCPVHSRGADGRIQSVRLDDMTEWRIARAESESGGALEIERTRLTKAQADKTELEVRELRAELVRMPVVEQHWQSMVASARSRLLALPSRIAAQIAGPDRLQQVQDKAQALVYEALAELAGDAVPEQIRNRAAAESERANDQNLQAAAEADDESVGSGKPGAKRRGQQRAGKVPA